MAGGDPGGFPWGLGSKARGAKGGHVDPRPPRPRAGLGGHVPLRAGTDIAFLGGIVNYVLQNERYFHEYVVHYTNGPTIVREDFKDTEDLDGFFSGFDPTTRQYDSSSWQYEGTQATPAAGDRGSVRNLARGHRYGSGGPAIHGQVQRDDTMQHPRCAFQILKRHYARYTPEFVERTCGVPQDLFAQVCELLSENSGRERTSAICY